MRRLNLPFLAALALNAAIWLVIGLAVHWWRG